MKEIGRYRIALAGIGVLSTALVSINYLKPEQSKFDTVQKEKDEGKKLRPNDYWVQLRGGENYDHSVYLAAMKRINSLKKNRAATRNGDLEKKWQLEGPKNIGGRINVITPASLGSDTMYVGAANGGAFRTFNGGTSWEPIFDFHPFMAIGAIAVRKNEIFIGTGDRKFGNESGIGDGIYHSTDYGNNWTRLGFDHYGIVSAISLDPNSPSTMVIASMGDRRKRHSACGVYRTTDGGKNWKETLFVDSSASFTDVVRDPNNSNILYACSMTRKKDEPHSLIFKSTDGGISWDRLSKGLPIGKENRVGIAVAKTNSNILYAVYVANDAKLLDVYKSTDQGESWTALDVAGNNPQAANVYGDKSPLGWYFGTIHVNPFDENHVILPGINMFQSEYGGLSWDQNVPNWQTYEVHADKHDVIFLDINTMVIATDGGLYKTTNRGATWSDIDDIPISQFYDITVSDALYGRYGGGCQDNGTISGNKNNISSWWRLWGGDGFKFTPRKSDYHIFETQNGKINLLYHNGNYKTLDLGIGAIPSWFTPYEFNEDREDMVVGAGRLVYFDNLPYGRQYISQDLTRRGAEGLKGKKEKWRKITELERAKDDPDHLLVGTNDGLIWKGSIAGQNWQNISNPDWGQTTVTSVNHSTIDPNTYFVSLTGYSKPFFYARIFKTTDGGSSWTKIIGDMPGIGVNDLLIPENGNDQVIFAATDGGVFLTEDGGETWNMIGTNLPTITVSEIELDLENNLLIAGTFGRAMWSYDISFLNLGEPNTTVSTSDNKLFNQELVAYPNPVSDNVQITNATENVKVFGQDGKLIHETSVTDSRASIDCSNWPKGMYIAKSGEQTVRFLKQ